MYHRRPRLPPGEKEEGPAPGPALTPCGSLARPHPGWILRQEDPDPAASFSYTSLAAAISSQAIPIESKTTIASG